MLKFNYVSDQVVYIDVDLALKSMFKTLVPMARKSTLTSVVHKQKM